MKLLSSALAFVAHPVLCWPSSEAELVRSKTRLAALPALSRGQLMLLRQAVQCLKRLGQGTYFALMGFVRSFTWPMAPADRAGTSILVELCTATSPCDGQKLSPVFQLGLPPASSRSDSGGKGSG